MKYSRKKLIKNKCEIETCNETDPSALHLHHVVERSDINHNNDPANLAILCSNCHNKLHAGVIKIIGIYPSTRRPNGRTLVYEVNGVKNVDIDQPYYVPTPKCMKVR